MSEARREEAIARAAAMLASGAFEEKLARRVAIRSESGAPASAEALRTYLETEIAPELGDLGFERQIIENPRGGGPFLIAHRLEDETLPTVLGYGHGDVIGGMDGQWSEGLSAWSLVQRDGAWFGRGTADNKGQHQVNLDAMRAVIETRGRLGFNAKFIFESGEEAGSAGLREVCEQHREALRADVLIASDGPRISAERPTIFLGSRGAVTFDLVIDAREGAHHSGNWGGLISNPGIELSHAIAALVGPTGKIQARPLVPGAIPSGVKRALSVLEVRSANQGPRIEPGWGEPGLTAAEKLYGWCSLEVLALDCGDAAAPVNAIPPRARARMQLRTVVGVDAAGVPEAVREHLAGAGLGHVKVELSPQGQFTATRTDPDHPYVRFAVASLTRTHGQAPAVLPNLGGSLPNEVFTDVLGLPTIWVPHSYPGCCQHAPDEHVPIEIVAQGLALMAGLYWDIGEGLAAVA